jgi:trehalose 6-phosphate synthase/phosphatase
VARPSQGGLATGLSGPHERSGGLWIGWPGDVSRWTKEQVATLQADLAERRIAPVYLSRSEATRYYEGFANGVLWPTFHYLIDRIPPQSRDWDAYKRVNERFADAVAARWRPGDLIWVHDYHLMLVPALLRERLPQARIGFFLHIPFPASDVFRALPWSKPLLEGLLGADVVGFHTAGYARNFASSVTRLLDLEPVDGDFFAGGRRVRVAAFPMGVDTSVFAGAESTCKPETKLVLGIDRLDYTKGIRRRMLSVARMFERHPELRGRVTYLQIAVPSRENIDEYETHRGEVDRLVGRLNGALSTADWSPIRYIYRGFSQAELGPMYRSADVMAVTPLRDGMNLVAKEFVAARGDEDGVLVLSELAGAADELRDAILVNPFDVDGVADALAGALQMPREERRRRMRSLRRVVTGSDVHAWARGFLAALEDAMPARPLAAGEILARIQAADRRAWLLDYDGTLVPFARTPDAAAPDPELLRLLARLAETAPVHLVSGRRREDLQRWFGHLPLTLHAEHGFWTRHSGGLWVPSAEVPTQALADARVLLDDAAARTPGAWVEEKTAGLAWHHRPCDPEHGAAAARELRWRLLDALANGPLDVLCGDKVVEVRLRGVHKGAAAQRALRTAGRAVAIAIGDDRTDEDLFAALGPDDVTVKVGHGPTRATHRLASPREVRQLLEACAELDLVTS